jgi:predicted ATP-dependent serine protease
VADQFQFPFEPLAPTEPLDPPQHVIEGIIAKNRLNVIYGMPGTYKTFIGTAMALAVAYMLDWCGFWTEHCEVLYCAADDPEGPQPRAQAWCQRHEIDPGTGKASIIKRPINFFNSITVTKALTDIKAQGQPKFVVIDTFFHSTVGADLSSAKEVLQCVAEIRRFMQETGATVLLIHHSPKDGQSLYGSVVLLASVDVVIKCETMADDLRVRLINERARGKKFKALAVELEEVTIQTKPDQRGRTTSSQPVVVAASEAPATQADAKTEKAEANLHDITRAAIWQNLPREDRG